MITIENIVNHPQHAEIVAGWVYEEFVREEEHRTLESVIYRFKNRNINKFPISLIAMSENKCVGVVSIFENDLGTRQELTPWLAGLYVDKNFRGNGVAELLIKEVLIICKELGFDKVYIRTEHTSNYYKKRGWTFLENTLDEYGQETSVFLCNI